MLCLPIQSVAAILCEKYATLADKVDYIMAKLSNLKPAAQLESYFFLRAHKNQPFEIQHF